MRFALTMVGCVAMVALSASAFAMTADGRLYDEWGVNLTSDLGGGAGERFASQWAPTPTPGSYLLDYHMEGGKAADDYTTGDRVGNPPYTGGEWYDIEALYVNFQFTDYEPDPDMVKVTNIQWALVTSHNYYDAYYDATKWDGKGPTIALDLNGDNNYAPLTPATAGVLGWEYGITLADSVSYNSSTGDERLRGIVSSGDVSGGYTAKLWNASAWNDATRPPAHPPIPVSMIGATWTTAASATGMNYWGLAKASDGTAYTETASTSSVKKGQEYGWIQQYTGLDQPNNWVWEGEISTASLASPILGLRGCDWNAFYSMPCGNDYGDGIGGTYGSPAVPEPASMALLALAVSGIGVSLRRRRAR